MTTTAVRERQIRTSVHGSGREHYHTILSKSRGLDRVIAVATFDTYQEAGVRAERVKGAYERMGFTAHETWSGSILELAKAGETPSYLMTRRCSLKHRIDG